LKKLLLVSLTPPGTRNVGEVVLQELCALLPPGVLAVCDVGLSPPLTPNYPYLHLQPPIERVWRPLPGRLGGLANHLRVRTRFVREVRALSQRILEFARSQGVERLLVVLNSQALNAMAAQLKRESGLPMSVIVWDPPKALALNQLWDAESARWANDRFGEAMRAADAAMVVSEEMVEEYGRLYGTRCEVVRHALTEQLPVRAGCEGPLRIGFAGTMYDSAQLNLLISALNACAWTLHGRSVQLRMVGNYYRFTHLLAAANVELLGWRDASETLRLLGECDFCYLPVAFTESFSELARLAFPTKLGSYLGAGCPVLVHGPETSTSVRFARREGIGESCTCMDAAELAAALARQADPERRSQFLAAVERARAAHFRHEAMRDSFARFLGVPASELQH
jgi:hypothetical protein